MVKMLNEKEIRTLQLEAAFDAKAREIPGAHIRMSFLQCYYSCFKAILMPVPGNMQVPALRRYMRYARLSMAEELAGDKNESPERICRLRVAREKAWDAYLASDRNGIAV